MICCIIIHEVLRLNIKLESYNYKRSWKMQILYGKWELTWVTWPNLHNKPRFLFPPRLLVAWSL
jgi:hypothetical protein